MSDYRKKTRFRGAECECMPHRFFSCKNVWNPLSFWFQNCLLLSVGISQNNIKKNIKFVILKWKRKKVQGSYGNNYDFFSNKSPFFRNLKKWPQAKYELYKLYLNS